jgi:hypothetical protein
MEKWWSGLWARKFVLPRDVVGLIWAVGIRPARLTYQPPANSTFLSQQTSHQYFSLRTNQHQPNEQAHSVHPTMPCNGRPKSSCL